MKTQIVSFHCVLKNKLGKEISSSFNSGILTDSQNPSLTQNQPKILQTLLKALEGAKTGDKRQVFVPADEAYGLYDSSRVLTVSRKSLTPNVQLTVGAQVVREANNGQPEYFRIIDLTGNRVTLDANHPLAGEDLVFELEVTEARKPTLAELSELEAGPTGHSPKYTLH
jgi:FKBP-type peptidyl-prolyl cis-trans isomerase SlyD